MKRILFSMFILATIFTNAWSQARLTSNKETHSFGQIEWKKPVTVEYVITNTGDAPLVLSNITTSCACAVADWTQTPIAPGGKGFVKATFDAKALGRFHKSIGIYSNAPTNLVYLHFTGEVVRNPVVNLSEFYSHTIGQILIDNTELEFPDTYLGKNPTQTIYIANQSDRPYEPVLMHLPSYLEAKSEPNVLQKGERGKITVTLLTDRLPDLGLTQTSVYLARFAGDKVGEENEIPVSVVLLPDLTSVNPPEKADLPVIDLSETTVNLHQKLEKKSKVTHNITITNKGGTALEISKLQVFNPAVGVDLKKNVLQPGEKTRLRISVDQQLLNKKRHPRILMITNDPKKTKVTIDLIIDNK
ncbi:DUF1573 domain-containing protein [Bacteroides sp. 519]|uniref:DUF1573 domain-containing protein n=1 Tax=Bacteroides sp. 519 TaxID=2302937 RepID=UPI0013D7E2E7|nr:DUF1573 domain-containing protein [Bacteroides sp. 519]NDV56512.1 DUF1573 domain-containing protein [Bacteroides sp. 519]